MWKMAFNIAKKTLKAAQTANNVRKDINSNSDGGKKLLKWGFGIFTLQTVSVMFIIIIVMVPLTFSQASLNKATDDMKEDFFRDKSMLVSNVFTWFEGGDEGTTLSSYLKMAYNRLEKKLEDGKYTESEIHLAKSSVIGWVYEKAYEYNFRSDAGSAPLLKDKFSTAVEIYDAQAHRNDLDAVRNGLGDYINAFDIQAMDLVGSDSLVNLMNFDFNKIRQDVTAENKGVIDKMLSGRLQTNYQYSTAHLIHAYADYNKSMIEVTDKILKDNNQKELSLAGSDSEKLYSVLSNQNENSGSVINNFADKFKPLDKSNDNYEEYAQQLIPDKKDFSAFWTTYAVGGQLKYQFKGYINGLNLSENVENDINKALDNMTTWKYYDEPQDGVQGKYYTSLDVYIKAIGTELYNKNSKEQDTVTHQVIDGKVTKAIESSVDKLNLSNSSAAEEKYRELLKSTVKDTSVQYYSVKPEAFNQILGLKTYGVETGNWLNPTITVNSVAKYKNIFDFLSTNGLNSKVKTDSNGYPIIAAIDTTTNQNYMPVAMGAFRDAMKGAIQKERANIQDNITNLGKTLDNTTDKSLMQQYKYAWAQKILTEKKQLKSSGWYTKQIASGGDNATRLTNLVSEIESDMAGKTAEQLNPEGMLAGGAFSSNWDGNYNALLNQMKYDCIIDPTLGNPQTLSNIDFYRDKMNVDVSKLRSTLNSSLKTQVETASKQANAELDALAKSLKLDNTNISYKDGSYCQPANITSLVGSGSRENDSTLTIFKFQYTVQEAVKMVAQEFYSQALSILGNGHAAGMNVSTTVNGITFGGQVGKAAYNNSYRYWNEISTIAPKFGLDPYLVLAMMAQESAGNPNSDNGNAAGLMQYEYTAHGQGSKQIIYMDGTKETLLVTRETLKNNPTTSIKVGCYMLRDSFKSQQWNIPVAISGYNTGTGGVNYIIAHHLGLSSGKDPAVKAYIATGDCAWLSQRQWYKTIGYRLINAAGGGDPKYLENSLQYYNTEAGMPYVIDDGGGKHTVNLGGEATVGTGTTDTSNPDSKYYSGKQLILWKEYYTDKKIFSEADKWAEGVWANNPSVPKPSKALSQLISEDIINYSQQNDVQNKVKGQYGVGIQQFQAIIAAYINQDCSFKINPYEKDVQAKVKAVGDAVIASLEATKGKDISFAVYYLVNADADKPGVVIDINSYTDFATFVKEKYQYTQQSNTSIDPVVAKVAQIVSGNKNVDTSNFFALQDNAGANLGSSIDASEIFLQKWTDQKIALTQIYNAELSDQSKALPLPQAYNIAGASLNNSEVQYNAGTIKISGGERNVAMDITKMNLTNNVTVNALKPKYIIIHESTQQNSARERSYYYKSASDGTSMNYLVDQTEALQLTGDNDVANHVGKLYSPTVAIGDAKNINSIGVEMIVGKTQNQDQVLWNNIALVKYLMQKYNIPAENVILESDANGSTGPASLKNNSALLSKFRSALSNTAIKVTFEQCQLSGSSAQQAVVTETRKYLGIPYVWGGTTPAGFDCSGLMQYVYRRLGVNLPRTAAEQACVGQIVQMSELQPGDMLFFDTQGAGNITHVGMYTGNGMMLHAPKTGDVVKEVALSDWYKQRFKVARRVI